VIDNLVAHARWSSAFFPRGHPIGHSFQDFNGLQVVGVVPEPSTWKLLGAESPRLDSWCGNAARPEHHALIRQS
jgi:hypothetical protein